MATHSSILAWRFPWTRRAWQATVHGVTKSRTRLSDWCLSACFFILQFSSFNNHHRFQNSLVWIKRLLGRSLLRPTICKTNDLIPSKTSVLHVLHCSSVWNTQPDFGVSIQLRTTFFRVRSLSSHGFLWVKAELQVHGWGQLLWKLPHFLVYCGQEQEVEPLVFWALILPCPEKAFTHTGVFKYGVSTFIVSVGKTEDARRCEVKASTPCPTAWCPWKARLCSERYALWVSVSDVQSPLEARAPSF